MQNFHELGLPEALTIRLEKMNFNKPTPIQAQAIPHALSGRDVLGTAQTGTGKTGAFGIPLIASLMQDRDQAALVMTPTRELAKQVAEQLQSMADPRAKIETALLIGGESIGKQFHQLRKSPRLIVGTPGRINDHLLRKSLSLSNVRFLVLDETDRMLDMGFSVQIEKILEHISEDRQTMLFSATLPNNIEKIAKKYLRDPKRVATQTVSRPAENIEHEVVRLVDGEKYGQLEGELGARKGSVILFMKTKYSTERMAKRLSKDGHCAAAIHGDLRQNQRDRVIAKFRDQQFRILVATDVAARGLDVPHIEHVINYDLPQVAEDYIHRIGRTARAGAKGAAVCFVTPADKGKWNAIHRLMDPDAKPEPEARSKPSRGKPRNGGGGRKRFHRNRRPRSQAKAG